MKTNHIGKITFTSQYNYTVANFTAMANPCSIFIEAENNPNTQAIMRAVAEEAWRIEQKYSRYRTDSIISQINNANGNPVSIDEETYHLLSLSHTLWQESQGVFDITSGVFRKIWTFNGQSTIPSQEQVKAILNYVGWNKVEFDRQHICLPQGMQIDFGGIGKEYAVDRAAIIAQARTKASLLVNFGGDIVAKGVRKDKSAWQVGIESKNGDGQVWQQIPLLNGAIATSGDVYKNIVYQGKRYGHIINAKTGYPVEDSPHTVTVAAPNCTEAGMLTTLAILQGKNAEAFLKKYERPYWIQW